MKECGMCGLPVDGSQCVDLGDESYYLCDGCHAYFVGRLLGRIGPDQPPPMIWLSEAEVERRKQIDPVG